MDTMQWNSMRSQEQEDWKRVTMDKLAPAIAKALGDGWQVAPRQHPNSTGRVIFKGDASIDITFCWNDRTRVSISGNYPGGYSNLPYGATRPEITIAHERGGETIAKEITRRFLPSYLELLAVARERHARNEEHEIQQHHTAERLARILGVQAPEKGRGEIRAYPRSDGFTCYCDVLVTSGNSVEIKLSSVDADTAEAVLQLLKKSSAASSGEGSN